MATSGVFSLPLSASQIALVEQHVTQKNSQS